MKIGGRAQGSLGIPHWEQPLGGYFNPPAKENDQWIPGAGFLLATSCGEKHRKLLALKQGELTCPKSPKSFRGSMRAITFGRTPGQPCHNPTCAEPACHHASPAVPPVESPRPNIFSRSRRMVPLEPVRPGHVPPQLTQTRAAGGNVSLSRFDFSRSSRALDTAKPPPVRAALCMPQLACVAAVGT